MIFSKNINQQAYLFVEKLNKLSGPQHNSAVRKVIVSGIFLIASEGLALAGAAYHSIALLARAFTLTVQHFQHRLPASLSWKDLFSDHVESLNCSLALIIQAPREVLKGNDLAKLITTAVATIFKEERPGTPQPPTASKPSNELNCVSRSWRFLQRHRIAAAGILISGIALGALGYLCYFKTDEKKRSEELFGNEREKCLFFKGANFTSDEKSFTCSIRPTSMYDEINMVESRKDGQLHSHGNEKSEKILQEINQNSLGTPFYTWLKDVIFARYPVWKCAFSQPRTLTYTHDKETNEVKAVLTCMAHDWASTFPQVQRSSCEERFGTFTWNGKGRTCLLLETHHVYDMNNPLEGRAQFY